MGIAMGVVVDLGGRRYRIRFIGRSKRMFIRDASGTRESLGRWDGENGEVVLSRRLDAAAVAALAFEAGWAAREQRLAPVSGDVD